MSFLSAGLISDSAPAGKSGGSGLLGVIAGFAIIFILVALLSFVRFALPPHMHFGSGYAPAIQQEQVRMGRHERECLIRRQVEWRLDFPRRPAIRFDRTTARD